MDRILFLVQDASDPRLGGADSFCDRLSCVYTVAILGVFSLLVTTRQYVGEPISCWCPVHFSSSNVDYANKVCWTTSTYFLPFEIENIPKEDDPRRKVSYYQWVSILLVFQAVLFYTPRAIWRAFNRQSGIAVSTITDAAVERQRKSDSESTAKVMRYMINQMGGFLMELSRDASNASRKNKLRSAVYGNYLIVTYLFVKIIYIANIVAQIFIVNAFLSTDYHLYGFDVLRRLARGDNWATSDRFPRVTLCDFKLRVLGAINRYTVQCTLPMNLLNEIFFIFLWFWFMFVGLATLMSLFSWLFASVSYKKQVLFIRNKLIAMDKFRILRNHSKKFVRIREISCDENAEEDCDDLSANGEELITCAQVTTENFVHHYLRRDGCFILRLVAKNASEHIAAELIAGLWEYYKRHLSRITTQLSEIQTTENEHDKN